MALDFATLEARAGAAIRARFRNATAVNPRVGVAIEGTFTSQPVEAPVGSRGMVSRDIGFVCSVADADAQALEPGAELEVTYRGEVTRWQVDNRSDDVATGDAAMTLKRPR